MKLSIEELKRMQIHNPKYTELTKYGSASTSADDLTKWLDQCSPDIFTQAQQTGQSSPEFLFAQCGDENNLVKLEVWLKYCKKNNLRVDHPQGFKAQNYKKPYGNTIIHEVLANEIFKFLQHFIDIIKQLKLEFDITQTDCEGKTPLMLALIVNAPANVIEFLLDNITYDIPFKFNYTSVKKAYDSEKKPSSKANNDNEDQSVNLSALDIALIMGRHDIIKLIKEKIYNHKNTDELDKKNN